jgi:hypothetical protein
VFPMDVQGKPGLKKIKFGVQSPALANIIWGAKSQLPAKVFLDPVLTRLESSNKSALWEMPEFKTMREVDKKKKQKGHWVLDEFLTKWQVGGKAVWVRYHKAYPGGRLADGKPAPPIPEVAAAAAGQ